MTLFKLRSHSRRRRSLNKQERENCGVRVSKPVGDPKAVALTGDQQAAIDHLARFEESEDREFLLSGFAGTGKTTTLQHWLRRSGKRIALTAPTNKAVRVLWEQASEAGLEVPCLTVHKLLKLRMATDAEEKYALQYDVSDIGAYDIVVVDECSMVGNEKPKRGDDRRGMHDRIIEEARGAGVKIVWVGDPGQLPPVKEGRESPSFSTENGCLLDTVVRQALDSPIIKLATYVRACMDGLGPADPELAWSGGEGVRLIEDPAEFDRLVVGAYREEPGHPTRNKALAWTNKRTIELNDAVRRELWGPAAGVYVDGERYVAMQPVVEWRLKEFEMHMATSDDALLVGSCEAEHPDYPEYRSLLLKMRGAYDEEFNAFVVHPDDEQAWRSDLDELAEAARRQPRRWEAFWALHDAYAHLRPHYAMTCHKSQGSTYENVFVDSRDVFRNSSQWEAWRCMYVACTRASKSLTILR